MQLLVSVQLSGASHAMFQANIEYKTIYIAHNITHTPVNLFHITRSSEQFLLNCYC